MKTNGLRNKKKAMARAAWRALDKRIERRLIDDLGWVMGTMRVFKWHRAAKGTK